MKKDKDQRAAPVEWPTVRGVGRVLGSECCLEVYFDREPTDDELRAIHEALREPVKGEPSGHEALATAQTAIASSLHIFRKYLPNHHWIPSIEKALNAVKGAHLSDEGVQPAASVAVGIAAPAGPIYPSGKTLALFDADRVPHGTRLYAAPVGAQPSAPDGWRQAVQTAYGHLWMVNNEPGTPNQYAPEKAAYAARKLLRGLLTKEERGEGINAAMLAAAQNPPADEQATATPNWTDGDPVPEGWQRCNFFDGPVFLISDEEYRRIFGGMPVLTAAPRPPVAGQDAPTPEEEDAWREIEKLRKR